MAGSCLESLGGWTKAIVAANGSREPPGGRKHYNLCTPGASPLELRRSIFLTEGSTPRRGRRVLPVTLGHHHKPFGSARTARALRALDLAGALHALWRTERPGAREKGVDQDRRTIRDRPHQRVLRRQRGLEWVRVLRNVSRAAREGTRQRRAATRDPVSPARNRGSPAGSLAAAPL